jgi:hypothetical protein
LTSPHSRSLLLRLLKRFLNYENNRESFEGVTTGVGRGY